MATPHSKYTHTRAHTHVHTHMHTHTRTHTHTHTHTRTHTQTDAENRHVLMFVHRSFLRALNFQIQPYERETRIYVLLYTVVSGYSKKNAETCSLVYRNMFSCIRLFLDIPKKTQKQSCCRV